MPACTATKSENLLSPTPRANQHAISMTSSRDGPLVGDAWRKARPSRALGEGVVNFVKPVFVDVVLVLLAVLDGAGHGNGGYSARGKHAVKKAPSLPLSQSRRRCSPWL